MIEDYNDGQRNGISWALRYLKEKGINTKDINEDDIIKYLEDI